MNTSATPQPTLRDRLGDYREALRDKSAVEVVAWAIESLGAERVALASSLGPEDQVLTEMVSRATRSPRIFTLDTGRWFQETYELMQTTMRTYGIRYEVHAPDADELAELLGKDGPNAMFESVAKREACCEVRKVRPLRRALKGLDAWICGLRRDQGPTRASAELLTWDDEHGLLKVAPLVDWSEEQVWQYIRERDVPHNALHSRGFRSIGCAPCTRATSPAEDIRAGRWWWEQPEHRECGLHRKH